MSNKPSKFSSSKVVSEPSQPCPSQENRVIPCDLSGLQLSGKDEDGKSSSVTALEPRSDRSSPLLAKDLPVQDDLKFVKVESYDAIIEVLASPFSTQTPGIEGVEVSASINTIIGNCPSQEHPELIIKHPKFESNDQLPKQLQIANKTMAPKEVFGAKLPFDDITSPDILGKMLISDFLYMFKDKSKYVKEISVNATACGIRDDGTKPVKTLKGLIRVHRRDKYNLKATFPSLWGKEAAHSEDSYYGGNVTHKEKSFGWDGEFSITEDKAGNIKSLSHKVEKNKYTDTTYSLEDETEDKFKSPVSFVLTCNGRHLIGNEFLNQAVSTYRKFKHGLDVLEELKESIPKIGSGVSLKWDAIVGEINGDWGLQEGSEFDTQEYKWVQQYGEITLALKLFSIELEAFLGIECKSPSILNWFKRPVFELILKIALKIKSECNIDTKFTLVGNNNREISQINNTGTNDKDYVLAQWTFDIDAELYVQAKVTVFGEGVDAKSSWVGGLNICAKAVKPFGLRAKGEWKEMYVSAYFTHFKRKRSKPWKHVMMRKQDMFSERYIFR